jgi:hypothetical protein
MPGQRGTGLIVIYKDGPEFDVLALDTDGRAQPVWAEAFRWRSARARKMTSEDAAAHDWSAIVARLTPHLEKRPPHAVAAVVVRDKQG